MPALVGGAILGGSVVSGLFGRSSQSSAQQFTTRQMKNKHQWETADLEKAGLNRILGYTKGGPPMGGSPIPPTPDFGGSAAQAMRAKAEIGLINANKNLTDKKAEAIGPASSIGGGIERLYDWIGENMGPSARGLQRQIDAFYRSKSEVNPPHTGIKRPLRITIPKPTHWTK